MKSVKPLEYLGACASALFTLALLVPVLGPSGRTAQQFSSYHAIALATHAYTGDYDTFMPLASFARPDGSWGWSSYVTVPAGWTNASGHDVQPKLGQDASVVFNALRAYGVGLKNFEGPGIPLSVIPSFTLAKHGNTSWMPAKMNVTYNGLLQSFSESAVLVPTRLTMFWQDHHENKVGFMVSNPNLMCSLPMSPCQFNPASNIGSAMFSTYNHDFGSVWNYGHASLFVSVDGTASLHTLESPTCPNTLSDTDNNPYACFESGAIPGIPSLYWTCNAGSGGQAHSTFFRPDKTFSGPGSCP